MRFFFFKIILLLSINFFYLHAYSQQSPVGNRIILNKLSEYGKKFPVERVYLQLDKPCYAAGDTIYFKAYVAMGERHSLSKISEVLNVDLIGIDNKANANIKLQLINGIGWGDFALPDSLPKGIYRVRGYTRWMRNLGNDGYFEKTVRIGSLHENKIPENNSGTGKTILSKTDLQFFPEAGELISGINTKIAFKAIDNNGIGVDVKGTVIDNSGKEVTSFASIHLGMGYFELKPEDGKVYKASITFADGSKEELPLPQFRNKGISLHINNDSVATATVRVQANSLYYNENKGKAFSLLIYSGGIATTVSCKLDSPTIIMNIIKRKLFTGIATVTLFSQDNDPIAERLIFVQKYDQLNLNFSTDKESYKTREKVSLKLSAKTRADSAAKGHFSISVTDESKLQVDENCETTILTELLLTSDLTGTIEKPNYYFSDISNQSNYEKQKQLDLVMLTHGYRRFNWKQVFSNDSINKIFYQPEKGLSISGTAKNAIGFPLKNGTVSLFTQAKAFMSVTTDDKGKFHFDNLLFTDSARFIIQAASAKGNNATQITYDKQNFATLPVPPLIQKIKDVNLNMITYLKNDEKQQEELNKMAIGKGRMLKQVTIRGVKDNPDYLSSNLGGPGHATQVVHRAELEKVGGPLSIKLAGKFHGPLGFAITSGHIPGSVLIVVDGVLTMGGSYNIDNVNGNDVETVELLEGADASIYGMNGGNGVIVITTRHGSNLAAKDIQAVGILPITVQGFYKAREFYSPKYDVPLTINHPDLRSTIYWAPEVVTDKDGNASIDFYNADGKGTYKVVIEGIDEKGNIGRRVYRYKVE